MLENISEFIQGFQLAYLALTISLVSLSAVTIIVWRVSNSRKNILQEIEKLEQRLRIVTSGSVGMGEKLVQLESQLADAINEKMRVAENEAQFSYTQALKLIESGLDHSSVMSNSGLSDSEVKLMELLHQTRAGAAQSS